MDNKELLNILENCGHFLHHRRGGRWGQTRILGLVAEKGELSQKELQDILKIQSGSLSEIVMKIEAKGYIVREKDSLDRRRIIIKITENGRDFLKRRREELSRQEDIMFDMLTDEEKTRLADMLSRLLESWERNIKTDDLACMERRRVNA